MHRLLFNVADRGTADANCSVLSGSSINFGTRGLQACSTQLSCSVATVVGQPTSYYTIRSVARCGEADMFAERIIEVSSFF